MTRSAARLDCSSVHFQEISPCLVKVVAGCVAKIVTLGTNRLIGLTSRTAYETGVGPRITVVVDRDIAVPVITGHPGRVISTIGIGVALVTLGTVIRAGGMCASHTRSVVMNHTCHKALTSPESPVAILAPGVRTRSTIVRRVAPHTFPTLCHRRTVTVGQIIKVTTGVAAVRTRSVADTS